MGRLSLLLLFCFILDNTATPTSSSTTSSSSSLIQGKSSTHRRILHQPLYPAATPPSFDSPPSPPPSPDNTDEPFFPEVPNSYQTPPPQTITNGSISIPTATQPNKPTKRVAIAISVGIVTLGMLSALAFFLYRHRARHSSETTQKLVNGNSLRALEVPQSNFLYIGTVEPPLSNHRRSAVLEVNSENAAENVSPYHKLNTVKRSDRDRYRPSPELHPLPPLSSLGEQNRTSSSAVISSSDEESHEDTYYTPKASSSSVASNEDVTPSSLPVNHNHNNKPYSKRTSPKTRLSNSSPDMKFVVIPSIKQPLPPPQPLPPQTNGYIPQKPKFSAAPPPPNMALLQSISNNHSNIPVPPPPPLPPLFAPRSVGNLDETSFSSNLSHILSKQTPHIPSPKDSSRIQTPKPVNGEVSEPSSLERLDSDEMEGGRPKLKALHWDKVRAISDRATVWDQLKSSSFQLNEDMMETLFGCNSANSLPKEVAKKSALTSVQHEHRVLDPKKSQNIAILLRALNVTRDEVSEALLDGTLEGLGAELLETLVKMAPTREEEIKLQEYRGDITKLGSAERFLKSILDIPFAFKRVEVMLYRANFDTEIKYLRTSFQTLEAATEELKNSRLFLKLLEAVLRAGNRMNVGTNRGDAKAFKLDTLLKLVDVKGTDGKTTLLHFVVQEITRSEDGITAEQAHQTQIKNNDLKKQGLKVVSGLSRDLINVKKAAGMDSYVLNSYVSKLEVGLEKVRLVLQYENPNIKGRFFESIKAFLREADKEIVQIKSEEKKALSLVKEATEYFHGDTTKEEAHPFRIFMIVRDFLNVLDHVCKDVGRMQDRTLVGSARSFRISSTAPLPVLNRYNFRQHKSSDEESMTP